MGSARQLEVGKRGCTGQRVRTEQLNDRRARRQTGAEAGYTGSLLPLGCFPRLLLLLLVAGPLGRRGRATEEDDWKLTRSGAAQLCTIKPLPLRRVVACVDRKERNGCLVWFGLG